MSGRTAPVTEFLAELKNSNTSAFDMIRTIMLGVDSSIAEGIKWNAPSFRTSEWFATINVRATSGIQIVLHLGAKVREGAIVRIPDPERLLKWLAKDRAILTVRDLADLTARRGAMEDVIREWIKHV
ncbi:MAG: DUF1801 domain-containing protein [Gemmatimonadales bacterium]